MDEQGGMEGRGREGGQRVVVEVVVVGQAASPLQLRALVRHLGPPQLWLTTLAADRSLNSLVEYAQRSYARQIFPLLADKEV